MFQLQKKLIRSKRTFPFCEKVMGLWLFIFGFQLLNAQLFIKNDVLKVQSGTILYVDTIIPIQNEIKTKKVATIYIVKGTLISERDKLKNAEIVLLSTQKNHGRISSESIIFHAPKKDITIKESKKNLNKETQKTVRNFPEKSKNIFSGNPKTLQISNNSSPKKQFEFFRNEYKTVNILFYDNENSIHHLIGIIGLNSSKSWKIRPPPIIC